MTEDKNTSRPAVRFRSGAEGDWKPKLVARFAFAPEKPQPGLPGKNPGDLVMVSLAGGQEVLVSLGKAEQFSLEMVRRAAGLLGKWLADSGAEELAIDLDSLQTAGGKTALSDLAEAALVGLRLGAYRFQQYKRNEEPNPITTVGLLSQGKTYTNAQLIERAAALTDAVIFARDLSHQPANVINPVTLAERAAEVAARSGLGIRVIDEHELAAMGAGALLAVGKGSQTPPRLIVLTYPGTDPSQPPVALVGKAITFDTGGYSIKSTESIVGMKYDKCGGVDVLATMQAAAALKIKTPLVGVISAAENMISGEAYRPDDIVTTLSGKTVEIISTDAEGRLVLSDALTYTQREFKPRAIIDLATLTGGVVVALGRVRAGLLSNDDGLAQALFEAGEKTGERLWRLPLDEEYSKNMKGDDADLKNSGGREGHCILGGAFLKAFIEEGVPWAHLDIAGTADNNKDQPYAPKGATGFGIRLLIEYLENLA